MISIDHIKHSTSNIVESPRYPLIQGALGAIGLLGIVYVYKNTSSFLSAKKIVVSSLSLCSLVFMRYCSYLKSSILSLKNEQSKCYDPKKNL
ncbi:MAG: hypothetical protein ACOVOR_04370 [Rhabdochlamydiaceae bacterium]